jgi:predicted amidohydrolase
LFSLETILGAKVEVLNSIEKMILASAQTKPKRGDIKENLLDHYRLIELASDNGADLIVFPEMSMSGYERENADTLAFSVNDPRLEKLKHLAIDKNMIIIAGAPIKIHIDVCIGEFILRSDNSVTMYTKQFLHPGEEEYFTSSFDYNPIIELDNEQISLAICADIDHPLHSENAHKAGSTMYISSIFFSPQGIPEAHTVLSSYAKKYSMNVLMSNYGGDSWGRASGGRSAFWNNKGELVAAMNDSSSGLLLVEKNIDLWTGQIITDT